MNCQYRIGPFCGNCLEGYPSLWDLSSLWDRPYLSLRVSVRAVQEFIVGAWAAVGFFGVFTNERAYERKEKIIYPIDIHPGV